MRGYNLQNVNERAGFFSNRSAVWWIIALNILVFAVEFILLLISSENVKYFALSASNVFSGMYLWTLFLHMFSHGGVWHLLVNMIALFSLGGLCEKLIGKKRFISFYLIAGLFAGLVSVILAELLGHGALVRVVGESGVYMLGASGAIFGIAGILMALFPRMRFSILFLPFFSFPAYVIVPIALFALWAISAAANLPVGNVAHFGGFLAGLVYGLYLRIKFKKKIMALERYFR